MKECLRLCGYLAPACRAGSTGSKKWGWALWCVCVVVVVEVGGVSVQLSSGQGRAGQL